VRNFQLLIISAVESCKQYLQTASASGDFTRGPIGDVFCPPDLMGYSPQMKIPGDTAGYNCISDSLILQDFAVCKKLKSPRKLHWSTCPIPPKITRAAKRCRR